MLQNFRKAVFEGVTRGLFTFSFLSLLAVRELHFRKCGMFYSLYQEYELKILCVSVKLAYWVFILQKNMQGGYLRDLQYC